MGSVLVLALDGMAHDLVQEWDLPNVQQDVVGRIDVETGISSIETSELFASFITGETHEVHGVRGLSRIDSPVLDRLERGITGTALDRGKARRIALYHALFGVEKRRYDRSDLQAPSLFDRVPDARAMFVPAWNPSPAWKHRHLMGYPLDELEQELMKEFHWRRHRILDGLDGEPHRLCMAHVHHPDFMDHLHGELGDMDGLRAAYERTDAFVGAAMDRADGYDTVICMSDHGRPAGHQHEPDAFYSCNRELFDGTPHITDFHDTILDLAGTDATAGLDV